MDELAERPVLRCSIHTEAGVGGRERQVQEKERDRATSYTHLQQIKIAVG
jgi:hypothetical protein